MIGRFLVLALAGSCCLAGCGDGGGDTADGGDGGVFLCDPIAKPCPPGQRCDRDRKCVEADLLRIVTESLPDGRVGFRYNEQIRAEGGLLPYTWRIARADPRLDFLGIDSRGFLSGSTAHPVDRAEIAVEVADDGYQTGATAERSYTISFTVCREGDAELCYLPKDGACYQGQRICQDGQMGECQVGADPSRDRNYCGPYCRQCDGAIADGCREGLCSCGSGAICSGTTRCCFGACIDVAASVENCGGCGNDCNNLIAHASKALIWCSGGVCDYDGSCERGWLDCDARRQNGCEQPVGVANCGDCGVDCRVLVANVSTSQKICVDTGEGFSCDYTGDCARDFGDCDSDRSSGCESYFNDPLNCGGCGVDCAADPAGHLCLSPDPEDPYVHLCGCRYDGAAGAAEGCDALQICCDRVCRQAATDTDHCGVCRAVCVTGGCRDAACGCASGDDCPSPSSATSCGAGGRCVCPSAGAGNSPCPPGQFCCDGKAGGSGGPNGDPDLGCCRKICGQNSDNIPCAQ